MFFQTGLLKLPSCHCDLHPIHRSFSLYLLPSSYSWQSSFQNHFLVSMPLKYPKMEVEFLGMSHNIVFQRKLTPSLKNGSWKPNLRGHCQFGLCHTQTHFDNIALGNHNFSPHSGIDRSVCCFGTFFCLTLGTVEYHRSNL